MSLLLTAQLLLVEAASKVSVTPNSGGLPGGAAAQKLINGLAGFALMACAAGLIFGAGQYVFGTRSNNYSQAEDGKSRMLKGAAGAFAIGAAAAVINFFFSAGSGVNP